MSNPQNQAPSLDSGEGGVEANSLAVILTRLGYYQEEAPLAVSGIITQLGNLQGYFQGIESKFEQIDVLEDALKQFADALYDCQHEDDGILDTNDTAGCLQSDIPC